MNAMPKQWMLLILLLYPAMLWANPVDEAMQRLNHSRVQLGMLPLQYDEQLSQAAQAHADYLLHHHLQGHGERSGDAGFTGSSPGDRAVTAGYPSRHVSENIYYHFGAGRATGKAAVDGLMTAIYHRFGFLDFDIDRVGIAFAYGEQETVTVFVMSNSMEAKACAQGGDIDYGKFYLQVCADEQQRVASATWEQAESSLRQRQPAWILWPAKGANDVTPAFSNESPDPLPDLEISGNPLSFIVNPDKVKQVKLKAFSVQDSDGRQLPSRLLNQHTDPHHKFNARQFALFPLQRLQWNQQYQAHVRAELDGEIHDIRWHFRTANPHGGTIYRIDHAGQQLRLPTGEREFIVYIPPSPSTPDVIRGFSSSYRGIAHLEHQIIDSNTLRFRLSGVTPGASIDIRTNNRFTFSVRLPK